MAVVLSWLSMASTTAADTVPITVVSLGLVVATIATYQFPIHLRRQAKVTMASVPYYLMAVLLPPPLAATAAALAALTGELSVRAQRGTYPSDVATESGRRALLALAGAFITHLSVGGPWHVAALVGAIIVLGIGDVVTYPLVLAPISGDPPVRIMVAMAREAYLMEVVQYLLGLLGALACAQQLWALLLLAVPTTLVYFVFKGVKEMQDSTRQLLEGMADTVDLRDPYTGGHSHRVADLCTRILRELEVHGPEAALIISAARVHDIGKIGIPDAVLNKQGPLSQQERAIMETHPEHGAALLRRYPDFARGVEVVLHHHESWDGTGYPHRLKGPDIPFGSRVIAVADSFDAMTSDRPYRRGMSAEKAAAILREGRGQQWDPKVVDALLCNIADQLARPAPALVHLVPERIPITDQPARLGTA